MLVVQMRRLRLEGEWLAQVGYRARHPLLALPPSCSHTPHVGVPKAALTSVLRRWTPRPSSLDCLPCQHTCLGKAAPGGTPTNTPNQ